MPEFYISEDLEIASGPRHDPRAFPPEVTPGQAPERAYEGLECPECHRTNFPEVVRPLSSERPNVYIIRSRWPWIVGAVLFV